MVLHMAAKAVSHAQLKIAKHSMTTGTKYLPLNLKRKNPMTKLDKNQLLGTMARFTYRADPKHDSNKVFDLVKPVVGKTQEDIKHNIKYYAMKTGAINAQGLTQQQYEEMVNEATKQTTSSTATEEENQTQSIA